MAPPKKTNQKLGFLLILAFLLVLPFGQLASVEIKLLENLVDILLIDIVALISVPIYLLSKIEKPKESVVLFNFIYIAAFSQLLSFFILGFSQAVFGSFYLVRLIAYFCFFVISFDFLRNTEKSKELVLKSVIVSISFASILGWIQYLYFSDLTSLKYIGWDDHLFRLAGTFFDPGFAGIMFAIGALVSLVCYQRYKKISFFVIFVFLALTVVFTYSRASFAALGAGIVTLFYLKSRHILKIALITAIFICGAFLLLPKKASEGTLLFRTQSIDARIVNYSETLEIFSMSPLFGVGFNNLCYERLRLFGGKFDSNACSGSDSSLLVVLATTGMVGLFVFLNSVFRSLEPLVDKRSGHLFLGCFAALCIHSLFVQSGFYPHVMGVMGILYALAISEST